MAAARGRRLKGTGRFLALPHTVLESRAFAALSGSALKLLIAVAAQTNGSNNGRLRACMTMARRHGFVSKATLARATQELLDAGFLVKCRHGGRSMGASLFAVAWLPIDPAPRGVMLELGPTIGPAGIAWKDNVEKHAINPTIRTTTAPELGPACPGKWVTPPAATPETGPLQPANPGPVVQNPDGYIDGHVARAAKRSARALQGMEFD